MADGRYAPSPTGRLHLGNLRTALLAWLFARSAGSRFELRIEDLDPQRSRERWVDEQLGDLRALGLDWDGPLLRQSERAEAYAAALERLADADLLYECFCTRREVLAASEAADGDAPPGSYPGTCRELSAAEREDRVAEGRPAALRVRTGSERIGFRDRLRGEVSGAADDFVVRRNDGTHAYNLAVVVDDDAQGVDEVVRGLDLLDSTPRQLWLIERLGLRAPSYAHLPLVLGPDGARLAKRHGAVSLADRLALGESVAEVRGALAASIGLCEPDQLPSPADLLGAFDPDRLATEEWVLAGDEPRLARR